MEEKSEIVTIPNKYKNTLDDFIDSSNKESLNWPDCPDRSGLIDKGSRNTLKSRSDSPILLEENCLNKDVSVTSLELMPKI